MRVIRVSRYGVRRADLTSAVDVLRTGGVVAFPTETSYGLAVDPTNAAAIRRVFLIKGRSANKALPLIAGSLADVRRLAQLTGPALALARRHWPGPLTLVLPSQTRTGTMAVRVPSSAWARRLANAFGRPITSTSANLSGEPPLYSGAAVRRCFTARRHRPDLILDVGRLQPRPPSTIVAFERGKMVVLRGKMSRA